MKNFVCAAVATLVIVGVALAEDFTTIISKVEDGKVTFKKFKVNEDGTTDLGDEQMLPTTASAKVVRGKLDKDAMKVVAGNAIEGGLKNQMFTKIDTTKKGKAGFNAGVFATITVEDGKITQIMVPSSGKGVKKEDAK